MPKLLCPGSLGLAMVHCLSWVMEASSLQQGHAEGLKDLQRRTPDGLVLAGPAYLQQQGAGPSQAHPPKPSKRGDVKHSAVQSTLIEATKETAQLWQHVHMLSHKTPV